MSALTLSVLANVLLVIVVAALLVSRRRHVLVPRPQVFLCGPGRSDSNLVRRFRNWKRRRRDEARWWVVPVSIKGQITVYATFPDRERAGTFVRRLNEVIVLTRPSGNPGLRDVTVLAEVKLPYNPHFTVPL